VHKTLGSSDWWTALCFSRFRFEGWPHHGRTFSIYLCPLSFWLTLPRGVLSICCCCPSRPCVVFLACVHLVLLSVKCNFDRLSNHFGFCPCVCVCVCVFPPIGCQTITSAILYRFSPNFAYRSEMWLFRTLLFLGQTGSSLPILEMSKVRFWQFCDCGGHIFPRIVTKTPNEI